MEKILSPEGKITWTLATRLDGSIDSIIRYPDKSSNNLIGQTIIHYTHLYPEILSWAFRDTIINHVDIPALQAKTDFFPVLGNEWFYFPQYTNLNAYTGFAQLLPEDVAKNIYETAKLQEVSLGRLFMDIVNNSLGYIQDNSISPELLSRITDQDVLGEPIPDPINTGNFMRYGSRFGFVWNKTTQNVLTIVIFLAFYLRQSISDQGKFLPAFK